MKPIALLFLLASLPAMAAPAGTLFKDANCGCCDKWAEHLAPGQLVLKPDTSQQMSVVKNRLKVPAALRSCHTALIDGYVFEGHVPADLVRKILKEKPAIAGLAVPGMPQGSPGMETGVKQSYQVVAFDRSGKQYIYANR